VSTTKRCQKSVATIGRIFCCIFLEGSEGARAVASNRCIGGTHIFDVCQCNMQRATPGFEGRSVAFIRQHLMQQRGRRGFFGKRSFLGRQQLRHGISPACAELAIRRAIVNVTVGTVEASGGLGAGQSAACVTSGGCPSFESAKQCPADALKPRTGRHVVQTNFSGISDRSYRKDRLIFDRHQDGVIQSRNPKGNVLRCLAAQPTRQNYRVISMIDCTKL
jgi:hypothetical protein